MNNHRYQYHFNDDVTHIAVFDSKTEASYWLTTGGWVMMSPFEPEKDMPVK